MPKRNEGKTKKSYANKKKYKKQVLKHYGNNPFFRFFLKKVFLENENWTIVIVHF